MATYSFMDVVATIVGPGGTVDLGYGAAPAKEGITTSFSQDKNLMTVGADGKVMHSLRCDDSGLLTVNLLKTSPAAAKLQRMYNIQKLSGRVWGVNTITIQQIAAKDKLVFLECAFKKCPDTSYAENGDVLPWTFDVGAISVDRGTY